MKTHVFILAGMLSAAIVTGQNIELKEIEIAPPTFTSDGCSSVNDYLQRRIEFPASKSYASNLGTVIIGFVVTPEGKLKNYKVINSLSMEIDSEVIQALKSTNGKWVPGVINGEAVEMPSEVSIIFKLYPEDNIIETAKKYLQKGNQSLFIDDQPKKALKYYNRSINLLPNDPCLLAVRGMCKLKLGDESGATRDWDRLKLLAKRNGTSTDIENLVNVTGNSQEYVEMLRALKK